ncbi:hypothetical protein RSal33209_0803 [Renibacterium salmoninarum ATCC 33209]|uniref:Uncharacterized protein n=1 Tax=Renibacterium salmoninarum (strain ATCC 33209 / DSM 20767 / JCM 11484 / NBRC 15589 / NCIMB 2235) TaxID=288705 RepID=A9WQI0_RENSM|nr:hypothetical protein RSal33209_0803 [Renibacterium salmoninarum ATCC 33209]
MFTFFIFKFSLAALLLAYFIHFFLVKSAIFIGIYLKLINDPTKNKAHLVLAVMPHVESQLNLEGVWPPLCQVTRPCSRPLYPYPSAGDSENITGRLAVAQIGLIDPYLSPYFQRICYRIRRSTNRRKYQTRPTSARHLGAYCRRQARYHRELFGIICFIPRIRCRGASS